MTTALLPVSRSRTLTFFLPASPAARAGRANVLAALVALALAPALTVAQTPVPVGSEFQVNSYTSFNQSRPAVTPDGAGGFVVVWDSLGSSDTDSSFLSIQGQRYAADGSAVGGEFQVNTYTTATQSHAAVGPDGAGGFVVLWDSYGSGGDDADQNSIQGQRYSSDGMAAGGEFQVNTHTTSFQSRPAVGPDGAGGFVVVWQSLGSTGTDSAGYSVQGQRFGSDGSPAGDEFQVNTYTTSTQTQPAVGPDGAGGFVVTWGSDGSSDGDISSRSVQGQRFGSDGSPVGGQFQINTYTPSLQDYPSVGPDGAGGFVVAWRSYGSSGTDSSTASVQAQRFGSDGSPAGDEFQVNTYTTSYQYRAHVGPDGAGGFVVVWDSDGSGGDDTSSFSVQGQRFGSDGSAKGSEFQVNTYTTSAQLYLAVGSDGAGRFIVVWDSLGSSGNDASGRSVQGQRMAPPEIFADGFESGDTSAWSNTVP